MKKYLPLIFIALLASCSSEEPFLEEVQNYEKRISVVASDLVPGDGTRTSYTETDFGYHFAWSEGDVLGIFPENGHQTDFPISNGYGTNTAVFDGGDWALKPNAKYAAYYPLVKEFELNPTAIPVDYTGQVQDGNNSTAHLGKYDYMATSFNQVDSKGNVNFELKHLGCLVQFKLKMPNADTFSKVVISSDNAEFITEGTVDLTENQASIKPTTTASSYTINLSGISTTSDNESLIVNTMIAPVDFSSSLLTVTVCGSASLYSTTLLGKDLANGSAYVNDSELEKTNIPNYITFEADDVQTLTMTKVIETLEYSLDNSISWAELGTNTITFGGAQGRLMLRGKNLNGTSFVDEYGSVQDYSHIVFENDTEVRCTGDIRSLLNYENYKEVQTNNARFCYLFQNCKQLITAPELPATILASRCYQSMFSGCTSLATAPGLPATSLPWDCYSGMFEGCTSLTTAPELPATTLESNCYYSMFNGCTSLTTVPKELPATSLPWGCYSGMFSGCTSLTTAPELPATTLAGNCYYSMFNGCTSLTTVPKELPATTLEYGCYSGMFNGCTSLTTAPELPATTLAEFCYSVMFFGCTSLATAPELPATDLAYYCYLLMFSGCTSLATVPKELPAMTLAGSCYSGMFSGCTSLTTAPELPATTLAGNCYDSMFSGCTSLTTAPELPATTLESGCYYSMFNGCTSLTTVPKELPATILASLCYQSMFSGCTSLATAPGLPATSLPWDCYSGMFSGCTSLTTAPELPTLNPSVSCYGSMFSGCTKLSYIKMMAIVFNDSGSYEGPERMLLDVSPTGTFVKNVAAIWDESSVIPEGWTVKYVDENGNEVSKVSGTGNGFFGDSDWNS